jgi:hypothetical protein
MRNTREKGKIARSEWRGILARHNSGETLASIAKSFGCTGPAIRYIVDKEIGRDDVIVESAQVNLEAGHIVREPATIAAVPRSPDFHTEKAIDQQLRERVNSDIAAFLVAFDSAFDRDSAIHRQALLEATDRLLRAAARTRLALTEEADRDLMDRQVHGRRAAFSHNLTDRRRS